MDQHRRPPRPVADVTTFCPVSRPRRRQPSAQDTPKFALRTPHPPRAKLDAATPLLFALHAVPGVAQPVPAYTSVPLDQRREMNAHQPTLLLRAASYPRPPPFSILPRLAGQQAHDRPGGRTPEVVQQVIDPAPHAWGYYSDASMERLFVYPVTGWV